MTAGFSGCYLGPTFNVNSGDHQAIPRAQLRGSQIWSFFGPTNLIATQNQRTEPKKDPQNISKREVSRWCCMLHLSGAQGTCRFSGFNVDWQKWVLTMVFLSLWRRYGWFDHSVIWIRILRIWVKSYILQGFTSKFVVIRRDTTLGKCGDHDALCYPSALGMGLKYVNIDVEIGLNTKSLVHKTFSQFGKSHSHSLPLSPPLFFKHLYRNVWIYFLISLFQSPFLYVSVLKGHTGSLEFFRPFRQP